MPWEPAYHPLTRFNDRIEIAANGQIDTYSGKVTRFSFVVEDGDVGDDRLEWFGSDDTLILSRELYDGNKDAIIGFGKNGVLDIDRIDAKRAGNDQFKITYAGDSILELRSLGSGPGTYGQDGYVFEQYVYAKASTLRVLQQKYGRVEESSLGNDFFEAYQDGAVFIDNGLGLDMGLDLITHTRFGQKVILTKKLRDYDGDSIPDSFVNHGNSLEVEIEDGERMVSGKLLFEFSNSNMTLKLTSDFVDADVHFYVYTIERISDYEHG